MTSANFHEKFRSNARYVAVARTGDPDLGPLKWLPGTWKNVDEFGGRGWNMIALPYADPDSRNDYRLLVNQYDEELKFTLVDKGVPNRGMERGKPSSYKDQLVVTLDYEQMVKQIAAEDRPDSGMAGGSNLAIHHEPGLFLYMTNHTTAGLDIARLASVPHGDAALALGRCEHLKGPPVIPDIDGLPTNISRDLNRPYLAPYKHYHDNPFKGTVTDPKFPGFDPVIPNELLKFLPRNIKATTVLTLDTTVEQGGIRNIPFIVRHANASAMQSTFWIMELTDGELVMAYSQSVMLDFYDSPNGKLIGWPHVSINMMKKVADADASKAMMPS